jgi:hypothetical protein
MAGSGGGSGGGSRGKAALAAAGAAGIITIIIVTIFGPGGGGKDTPRTPTAVASSVSAASGAGSQTAGRPTLTPLPSMIPTAVGSEGEAKLTIIAYGLPARISPTLQGTNQVLNGEFREQCTPEVQFPKPCIFDYKVKKGSSYTITAGDSRAGFWPVLASVSGPGCNLSGGSGRDVSCTIQVFADVEITAKYSNGEVSYPVCPANISNRPAWLKC